MPVGFQQRECCPLCASNSNRLLCEIPYSDQRLAEFIERFYRGRVAYKSLQSASYRIVLCLQCDFIYQDAILDEKGMQTLYEDWIDHQHSLQKKQTAGTSLYRQYAGGGGGYGDPAKRDRATLAREIRNGVISLEAAKANYGYEEGSS